MIRLLKSSDKEQIQDMVNSDIEGRSRLGDESIFDCPESSYREPVFVYLEDGMLVGYIKFIIKGHRTRADVGQIFVHKDYRGKGISRKLIFDSLELIAMDIKVLSLLAYNGNPAIEAYKKLGFEQSGISYSHGFVNGQVLDGIYMVYFFN